MYDYDNIRRLIIECFYEAWNMLGRERGHLIPGDRDDYFRKHYQKIWQAVLDIVQTPRYDSPMMIRQIAMRPYQVPRLPSKEECVMYLTPGDKKRAILNWLRNNI